ncbi:MAG: hypothetical protein ACKVP3_26850 [Hyphomicrobiaceae bacterium]
MTNRIEIEKLAAELSARHRSRIELDGLDITDLCFLHAFLAGVMSGKQETVDPSRSKEAVDRLESICERAIEAEELG